MAVETVDTRRYLKTLMKGDPALMALLKNFYLDEPPIVPPGAGDDAAVPYGIANPQSPGVDTNSMGGVRVLSRQVWQIKAVGMGKDFGTIESAATRMDELLQGTHTQRGSYGLYWRRISVIDYVERQGDRRYNHLGGLYVCLLSGPGTG